MKWNAFLVGLSASLLFVSSAFGASYFVAPVKATGMSRDDAASVEELVKNEVPHENDSTLAKSAKAAEFVLQPKVLRLGRAYVVVLEKLDNAGKLKFSSQLKASAIEEFDTVAARLVRSVVDEVPVKDDAQLGEVTQDEARGITERREAMKFWVLGFGPGVLLNLGSEGVSYDLSIGYDWDLEEQAALELFWDGLFNPQSASMNDFGLRGMYFFNSQNNAPLVLGDFGYGLARSHSGDNEGGFELGAGPGMRFFRTSRINLEVDARFGILLRTVDGKTPSSLALMVSLLF